MLFKITVTLSIWFLYTLTLPYNCNVFYRINLKERIIRLVIHQEIGASQLELVDYSFSLKLQFRSNL